MATYEEYNGLVLPDGTRAPFIEILGVEVRDINIVNHPAYNRLGERAKTLFATKHFIPEDYIGAYGGKIKRLSPNDIWGPYQLTPDPNGDYFIDGELCGNMMRYINDPRGTKLQPNAKFYQSHNNINGFSWCVIHAIADIKPGDEILVEYGEEYWTHLAEYKEKQKPHHCDQCDFKTTTRKNLLNHITRKHSEKTFQCVQCDREYANDKSLREHINNVHTRHTIHCNECDFTTTNSSLMSRHRQKHRNLKYKCFTCNKDFATRSALNTHQQSHDGRTYACSDCDTTFMTKSGLHMHKQAKHNGITFQCPECDHKPFTSKVGMQFHIKYRHTPQPEVQCNECGKMLKNDPSLRAHMRHMHMMSMSTKKRKVETPYNCDQCDATFATATATALHKITHF